VWFVALSGASFVYLTDFLPPAFKATSTTPLSVNLLANSARARDSISASALFSSSLNPSVGFTMLAVFGCLIKTSLKSLQNLRAD
jgi:hypothetical protein